MLRWSPCLLTHPPRVAHLCHRKPYLSELCRLLYTDNVLFGVFRDSDDVIGDFNRLCVCDLLSFCFVLY